MVSERTIKIKKRKRLTGILIMGEMTKEIRIDKD